ncbi:MAG: 2-C-methyl-D-erythritol 4-phosphate cytidylyltransferase, partial [Bacteroidota bacterium]|nr:2-C-methyl-D-erythritol 4-phosphate cytidylyltransferase [Bacteroidota bacterium]
IRIVLVLPESDISTWEKLAAAHQFNTPVIIVKGGATRFQSVRNGLSAIPDEALVAIHDGVRPLVTPEIIRTSFELARDHGCAIAAVKLKESLRVMEAGESDGGFTRAVDRSLYRVIQTPQTFRAVLIKKAYEVEEDDTLTDDASVAEKAGIPVILFEGHYNNIKITNREDLVIAEALMGQPG